MKALHSKIIVSMVDTGSNPTSVYHNAILDAFIYLIEPAKRICLHSIVPSLLFKSSNFDVTRWEFFSSITISWVGAIYIVCF